MIQKISNMQYLRSTFYQLIFSLGTKAIQLGFMAVHETYLMKGTQIPCIHCIQLPAINHKGLSHVGQGQICMREERKWKVARKLRNYSTKRTYPKTSIRLEDCPAN